MKDLFVPYEQALDLKELGFDEPCFGYYEPNKEFKYVNWEIFKDFPYLAKNSEWQDLVAAPTFSQAFRWFREKYNLLGCPQYFTGGYYCYTINDMKGTAESNRLFTEFASYKAAELACLDKLIEIVKAKENEKI